MWTKLVIFATTLVLGNAAQIIGRPSSDKDSFKLLILHNNDMHARFEQTNRVSAACSQKDQMANKCYGGFARVAYKVREARKAAKEGTGPPVLYLNAGDTYTGTIWFTVHRWKIAADFINILKPDAVSLGNHEFDEGPSGLSPFIHSLTCPVLCANINVTGEPELQAQTNLVKSAVLNVEGRPIGVVGYLTPETASLAKPNKVTYEDEVPALQREVNMLINKGVNVIIALGHSGFETDRRIAKEVKGVDLVIGGHTNTFLWNGEQPDVEKIIGMYPTVETQKNGKKVPVVQAYAYTKYLGKLDLTIDAEGEITHFEGQPLLLDSSIPQEEDVLQLLEKFRPGVINITHEILGTTKVYLDATGPTCRLEECNLGNAIADSFVHARVITKTVNYGWTDAPIGLCQGGMIRNAIDVVSTGGNISRSHVLDTLPFENTLVVVKMTGAVLLEVIEWSVSRYSIVEPQGAFMQYSGIKVVYDLSREPGNRALSVEVRCGNCTVPKYSPLDKNAMYTAVIPSFLHQGGDGYKMFQYNLTSSEDITISDTEAFAQYIKRMSPMYPEVEGRVTLLNVPGLPGSSSPKTAVASLLVIFAVTALRMILL